MASKNDPKNRESTTEIELLKHASSYWEDLWKKAANHVLILQAEIAALRGQVTELEAALKNTKAIAYQWKDKWEADKAALREQVTELEQYKSKYHDAMNLMAEWKNIDDTAAIAERWNQRLAATRVEGRNEAMEAIIRKFRDMQYDFTVGDIREAVAALERGKQ